MLYSRSEQGTNLLWLNPKTADSSVRRCLSHPTGWRQVPVQPPPAATAAVANTVLAAAAEGCHQPVKPYASVRQPDAPSESVMRSTKPTICLVDSTEPDSVHAVTACPSRMFALPVLLQQTQRAAPVTRYSHKPAAATAHPATAAAAAAANNFGVTPNTLSHIRLGEIPGPVLGLNLYVHLL